MGGLTNRRIRAVGLFVVGVLAGAFLVSPAGAHVTDSVGHLWQDHIRPAADERYANAVPGTDDAKNAEQLENRHAQELLRASYARVDTDINDFDTCALTTVGVEKMVTAPRKGILMIWANVDAERDSLDSPAGTDAQFGGQIFVDGTAQGVFQEVTLPMEDANFDGGVSVQATVPVLAGARDVELRISECGGGKAFVKDRSVSTLYLPYGDTGLVGVLGGPAPGPAPAPSGGNG